MTEQLIILLASFYIYCLAGWIWESIILPLSRHQKPHNRGFLNGPWIPIYGFGAILVIILYDIRQVNYPLHTLFINGGVVACLLEYVTSYVMEKLFHQRWWDYSKKPFNLNGRICLEGFVCFGLFSMVAISFVQPFFTRELMKIDSNLLFIISGILTVLFIVDTIISTHIALDIEKKVEVIKVIIEKQEQKIIESIEANEANALSRIEKRHLELQRQRLVIKILIKNKKLFKYGHRRLIQAFPNLVKKREGDKK